MPGARLLASPPCAYVQARKVVCDVPEDARIAGGTDLALQILTQQIVPRMRDVCAAEGIDVDHKGGHPGKRRHPPPGLAFVALGQSFRGRWQVRRNDASITRYLAPQHANVGEHRYRIRLLGVELRDLLQR